MPTNQFQRMVFAFLTVLVTVHTYVFYSLYVVNGATLMEITGADSEERKTENRQDRRDFSADPVQVFYTLFDSAVPPVYI